MGTANPGFVTNQQQKSPRILESGRHRSVANPRKNSPGTIARFARGVPERTRREVMRSLRWFEPAVKDSGVQDAWYCNRHPFASGLVMAGIDLVRGVNSRSETPVITWRSHISPRVTRSVRLAASQGKVSQSGVTIGFFDRSGGTNV